MSRRSRRWALVVGAAVVLAVAVFWIAGGKLQTITAPAAEPTGIPSSATSAEVVRVIDGDTFTVQTGGVEQRIRLLGVDTPETVDPDRDVECYGPEASAFLTALLPPASTVYLQGDPSQGDTDRYGRALRYAWTPDGQTVQDQLLAGGYARLLIVDRGLEKAPQFTQSAETAKLNDVGMWNKAGCAA